MILQSGHDFTRSMAVQPSLFVSTQPACAAAAERGRGVGVEMHLDQTRDQVAQLWRRQRRGPDFFPAASPDSGTTRPAATGSDGGATPANSSPGSPPTPPRPWRARSIPRSGAPPSTPAPIPPAARLDPTLHALDHQGAFLTVPHVDPGPGGLGQGRSPSIQPQERAYGTAAAPRVFRRRSPGRVPAVRKPLPQTESILVIGGCPLRGRDRPCYGYTTGSMIGNLLNRRS